MAAMMSGQSAFSHSQSSINVSPRAATIARYTSLSGGLRRRAGRGHDGLSSRWSWRRHEFTSTTIRPSGVPKSNAWPSIQGNGTNPCGVSSGSATSSRGDRARRPSTTDRTMPRLIRFRCSRVSTRPRFAALIFARLSADNTLPVLAARILTRNSGRSWAARNAARWSGVKGRSRCGAPIRSRCSADSGLPLRAAAAFRRCSNVWARPSLAARIFARASGPNERLRFPSRSRRYVSISDASISHWPSAFVAAMTPRPICIRIAEVDKPS